jgi:hypothetical protein
MSSLQNATPTIVFNNIFSYLSPGFLWVVCRRVCKSWKLNVENGSALYGGIEKNGLLQFSIHKRGRTGNVDELQLYRCTKYDMNKGMITFGPLNGESCILDNDTIYRTQATRYNSIQIGKISNGLFPDSHPINSRGKRLDLERRELRTKGQVRVFNPPTGEVRNEYLYDNRITMTQQLVDKFHSKPLEKEFHEYRSYGEGQSFPVEWHFDTPEVDLQLVYGPYIFKCRYITSMKPAGSASGDEEWDLYFRLIINEIEIAVHELCKWRCSCRKGNVWLTCDLETLSTWRCPSLFSPANKIYRHAFIEHCEPYSDSAKKARKALKDYEAPVWKDLIPRWVEEEKERNREYVRDTPPCSGCHKWLPSKRCPMNLCKHCCRSSDCKMHKSCAVCRLERYERTAGLRKQEYERRECLRHYCGVKCSDRRKAASLAWQLYCMGHDIPLIHKFPRT